MTRRPARAEARPVPEVRRRRRFGSFRHLLPDGAATTLHLARYPLGTRVSVVALDWPRTLGAWCADTGVSEAIVGGFFVRPVGDPLGELWVHGSRADFTPFDEPWDSVRACIAVDGGQPSIARRDQLPEHPRGDVLQAGPMLVRGGVSLIRDGHDPEGFSAGSGQFDSDITVGRYPRAAFGISRGGLLALACDGRSEADAGLTLGELADVMIEHGALAAINLDGGGSTSLVSGGRLRNRPREEHGIELVAGRPISTAVVFDPR